MPSTKHAILLSCISIGTLIGKKFIEHLLCQGQAEVTHGDPSSLSSVSDGDVIRIFQRYLDITIDSTNIRDFTVGCDQIVKLIKLAYPASKNTFTGYAFKMPLREVNKLSAEVHCTRRCFQIGIPSPTVLFCSLEKKFLIETLVQGHNLESLTHFIRDTWTDALPESQNDMISEVYSCLQNIYVDMGRLLCRLHLHSPAPVGQFKEYASDLELSSECSFQNALDYYLNNRWMQTNTNFVDRCKDLKISQENLDKIFSGLRRKNLDSKIFSDAEIVQLQHWYRDNLHVIAEDMNPVLCHGDLDDSNVMVAMNVQFTDPSFDGSSFTHPTDEPKALPSLAYLSAIDRKSSGSVTGFVDFGDAFYGAASSDLNCMFIKHYGKWSWTSFFHSYLQEEQKLKSTCLVTLKPVTLSKVKVYAFQRLLWMASTDRHFGLLKQIMSEGCL